MATIASNAGQDGGVICEKVSEAKGNTGYNAATDVFEDLVKAGVIDPTKVTRTALGNAASVATLLGMKVADDLRGESDRHAVAVIGDGAFPSGIVFEAMNNARKDQKKFLVVLNDNKMSICPRVGGIADYLDRLRTNPYYTGLKSEVVNVLNKMPLFGDPVERFLAQLKEGVKAGLHGGMLFEDLGFRYIGPTDGHDVKALENVKDLPELEVTTVGATSD